MATSYSSLAGMVRSVVLPILGAVPDGAIMLFSGLGPDAQEQLQVGVGALAGSTIMLLTIPWGGCILVGGVPIGKSGDAAYGRKAIAAAQTKSSSDYIANLNSYGVTPDSTIQENAKLMVGTALCYLLIQGPAFQYAKGPAKGETPDELNEVVAGTEHWWSLAGLVASVALFFYYIAKMMQQSGEGLHQDKIDGAVVKQLESNQNISLSGIIGPILADAKSHHQKGATPLAEQLLDEKDKKRLKKLLTPFFKKYDIDGDGRISTSELVSLLKDIGEKPKQEDISEWMKKLDTTKSGFIDNGELVDSLLSYIREKIVSEDSSAPEGSMASAADVEDPDEEESEEAEMPEEFSTMTYQEQQSHIKMKAAKLMAIGLSLILVFSDPMVEVMSNVGDRLTIPPFYVAFTLAPLASNASELLASIGYAGKKSKKTITVALAALEGAACMNNTFCLAIFMLLVYLKGLAWKFTAETLSILLIELIVAAVAMQKTQTMVHAIFVLSLFPISIVFVAVLEGMGFD